MARHHLQTLAEDLGVSGRTLRRAADIGLIRGEVEGPRRFRVPVREQAYLRRNWGRLAALREALRTEPNVRLAVLFGSLARGDVTPGSDTDLLVELSRSRLADVAVLGNRVEDKVGHEVQLVRVGDAESSAPLLSDVLRDGRVLIDRDQRWPAVRRRFRRILHAGDDG